MARVELVFVLAAGFAAGCAQPPGHLSPLHLRFTATATNLTLAWDDEPEADRLTVFMDDLKVATYRPTVTMYVDDDASDRGSVGPLSVTASSDREDGVFLSWSAVATAGRQHVWGVIARNAEEAVVERITGGFSAPTPTFDVSVDEGATWVPHGAATTWLDTTASSNLDLSSLDTTVEADDRRTAVRLTLTGDLSDAPGPNAYRVRARSELGVLEASATGIRRATGVTVMWERSAADSDSGYAPLPFVSGWRWFDPSPVLDQARWYRPALHFDNGRVARLAGKRVIQWGAREVVTSRNGSNVGLLRRDGTLVVLDMPYITWRPSGPFDHIVSHYAGGACGRHDGGIWECGAQTWPPPGGDPLVELSAEWTTCGLKLDGGIACWDFAQHPLSVPGGPFKAISGGNEAACGLRTNGNLECWSYNSPTQLAPVAGVLLLSTSNGMAALLADGRLLDVASGALRSIPIAGDEDWLGTGGATCVRRATGQVTCVDCILQNRLWCSESEPHIPPPFDVASRYESQSTSIDAACGIVGGALNCYTKYPMPSMERPFAEPVEDIAVGFPGATVLRRDGTIASWGGRGLEYLVSEKSSLPYLELAVSSGYPVTTCGLTSDGRLHCDAPTPLLANWADPRHLAGGQAMCGLYDERIACDDGTSLDGQFVQISTGAVVCGLTAEGDVVCSRVDLSRRGDYQRLSQNLDGEICGRSATRGWECWPNPLPVNPRADQVEPFADESGSVGYCELTNQRLKCAEGIPWAGRRMPEAFALLLKGRYRKFLITGDTLCAIRTDGVPMCVSGSANIGLIP